MTHHETYLADKGLIIVTQTGEARYADLLEVAPELARLMEQHKTHLAVIDLRSADLRISVPELYFVTKRLPELGVLAGTRLAFVCPHTETNAELFDFYSLAARQRGYRTRLFETIEAAETWLREGPPPEVDTEPS